MARIFRQTYTRPIPSEAEFLVANGKNYARFRDRTGKIVTFPVTSNGKSILCETAKWYIQYEDENGLSKAIPGFKDKKATECHACEVEKQAEHIRCGYKPKEHYQLSRPLIDHLQDFKNYMLAKGNTMKQVQQVYNRVYRIIEECHFVMWKDIDGYKIQQLLSQFRKNESGECGVSNQTSNFYLQSIKTFCNWLHKENRSPSNPLTYLQGLNTNVDRRHDRRPLTIEECRTLLSVTAAEPFRFGMYGEERALLYRTALETGFRANELKTLVIDFCNLNFPPPTLTVKASYSKHRKQDVQPIPEDLAIALGKYIKDRARGLLFETMPKLNRVSKMIRSDLEAAKIQYCDESDRYVDFHALRHTFITNLAMSGVHPKMAMDLARHGDVNLTLSFYSHTLIRDRATELNKLPTLVKSNNAEFKKTLNTA